MNRECSSRHDGISLAHADLPDQHGLSGFGLALQLLRLNFFVPSDVFSVFGLRLRYSDDWSYRIATSQAAQRAILARVPVPGAISSGWDVRSWLPFSGTLHEKFAWQLRGCPACFRHGYHTNLFQMPWIDKCPWHRARLITCCQCCGARLGASIDRETPLLVCPCGHDSTDHSSLLERRHPFSRERNHFIDRYLRWSAASRKLCVAFGNDGDNLEFLNAIAKLIRLPLALAQGAQIDRAAIPGAHEQRVVVRNEVGPSTSQRGHFQSCCESFWTRDPTMVEIPSEASVSLAKITRSWGMRCPTGSLSQIEERRFGVKSVTGVSNQPSRVALVLFPPYSVKEHAYFDGRVLARDVYQVLSTLCGSHLSRYKDCAGVSEDVTRRTLAAILARGYADALSRCLTQYVPEVAAHSRRPGMSWHPVVLCRYSRRGGWSHIIWTRRTASTRPE